MHVVTCTENLTPSGRRHVLPVAHNYNQGNASSALINDAHVELVVP